MKTTFSIFLFTALFFIQCSKPEEEAEKSLIGNWKIDSIFILYTSKSSPSLGIDSIWKIKLPTGNISFTSQEAGMDYNLRNRKVQEKGPYELLTFKENAGFTKVRKWEIKMTNKTYQVEFGDETKNAHKSANKITLSLKQSTPQVSSEFEKIFLTKK